MFSEMFSGDSSESVSDNFIDEMQYGEVYSI